MDMWRETKCHGRKLQARELSRRRSEDGRSRSLNRSIRDTLADRSLTISRTALAMASAVGESIGHRLGSLQLEEALPEVRVRC